MKTNKTVDEMLAEQASLAMQIKTVDDKIKANREEKQIALALHRKFDEMEEIVSGQYAKEGHRYAPKIWFDASKNIAVFDNKLVQALRKIVGNLLSMKFSPVCIENIEGYFLMVTPIDNKLLTGAILDENADNYQIYNIRFANTIRAFFKTPITEKKVPIVVSTSMKKRIKHDTFLNTYFFPIKIK